MVGTAQQAGSHILHTVNRCDYILVGTEVVHTATLQSPRSGAAVDSAWRRGRGSVIEERKPSGPFSKEARKRALILFFFWWKMGKKKTSSHLGHSALFRHNKK